MNRYAFFYLMKPEPERIRATVPRHVAHWKKLAPADYLGGPFVDRSGGLITFSAPSADEAKRMVEEDPFVSEGLLQSSWLKPWLPE